MLNDNKIYLAPIDKKLQDSEDTTHPSVSDGFFSVNHKTIQLLNSRNLKEVTYFRRTVKHQFYKQKISYTIHDYDFKNSSFDEYQR